MMFLAACSYAFRCARGTRKCVGIGSDTAPDRLKCMHSECHHHMLLHVSADKIHLCDRTPTKKETNRQNITLEFAAPTPFLPQRRRSLQNNFFANLPPPPPTTPPLHIFTFLSVLVNRKVNSVCHRFSINSIVRLVLRIAI